MKKEDPPKKVESKVVEEIKPIAPVVKKVIKPDESVKASPSLPTAVKKGRTTNKQPTITSVMAKSLAKKESA